MWKIELDGKINPQVIFSVKFLLVNEKFIFKSQLIKLNHRFLSKFKKDISGAPIFAPD